MHRAPLLPSGEGSAPAPVYARVVGFVPIAGVISFDRDAAAATVGVSLPQDAPLLTSPAAAAAPPRDARCALGAYSFGAPAERRAAPGTPAARGAAPPEPRREPSPLGSPPSTPTPTRNGAISAAAPAAGTTAMIGMSLAFGPRSVAEAALAGAAAGSAPALRAAAALAESLRASGAQPPPRRT
jgi:hypothetical protein